MDKILLLMVIAGDPQIIQPMDSAADCLAAAQLINQVHDKMLWCGCGGCSGKDIQVTCWDPKVNTPVQKPVDTK